MFEKGASVKCVEAALGITKGKVYVVTRFYCRQTPDYDVVEVTNDAGVIRQPYLASHFVLTDEEAAVKENWYAAGSRRASDLDRCFKRDRLAIILIY